MNRMTTWREATLVVMFAVLATGILSSVSLTNMAYAQTNSDNHPVICGAGPFLLGIIGHPWFSDHQVCGVVFQQAQTTMTIKATGAGMIIVTLMVMVDDSLIFYHKI